MSNITNILNIVKLVNFSKPSTYIIERRYFTEGG